MSARRVAAMVVAIGYHVFLLMVLLRPVAHDPDVAEVLTLNNTATLEVRFISPPRPTRPPPVNGAPRASLAPSAAAHVQPGKQAFSHPPPTQLVTLPSPPQTEPRPPDTSDQIVAPQPYTNTRAPASDGGFRERLFDAQHAQRIRGIPGSDAPVASGIQLTDPMNQGVGAVLRSTQRLFGITDRHCIDVEVWQSLSPDELTARHLSPEDVKREDDKYNCNRPLGLNF